MVNSRQPCLCICLVFEHSQSSTVLCFVTVIKVEMNVEILKKIKQEVLVVSKVVFYTLEKVKTDQTRAKTIQLVQ